MPFKCDALAGAAALLSVLTLPAVAQILPDGTLGAEGSFLMEDVDVRGDLADLVEGGATRGGNLFHSFLEFNVDDGQRVYFANPVGIESILSRVTGENPSSILGLLGVDGGADLFLLNPNGLVFGETATFDIEGSFYGTTGDAVALGDEVFSATEPESSRLLRVNPSILLENYLTADSGDIESRGQLAVLGNLVLAGSGLDLQGQVAAGDDLTLLGLDRLRIRDSAETPFVGFAGGDLLVQGNQQVDIVALSHPDSGLFSYGDMVLRSGSPVGGDAHYWSGGGFRVETLDAQMGRLYSPDDPFIVSSGDVSLDGYLGASLHIFAGGKVEIPFGIEIIAPDVPPGVIDDVVLSDGSVVEIRGAAEPTVEIRAGVDQSLIIPEQIGVFNLGNGIFIDPFPNPGIPNLGSVPTGSDIRIGRIVFTNLSGVAGGTVLLTNNHEPNDMLPSGNIEIIDTQEVFQGDLAFAIGVSSSVGEGGAVFIDSRGNIEVEGTITSSSLVGNAGNVKLIAGEDILLSTPATNDPLNPLNLSIQLTGPISGSVDLTSGNEIVIIDSGIAFNSFIDIPINSSNITQSMQSGDITLNAHSLILRDSFISASSVASIDAGDINIQITDSLVLEGPNAEIVSDTITPPQTLETVGNAGNINIEAGSLIADAGEIRSSTINEGNTGRINVRFNEVLTLLNGAGIVSNVEQGSTGDGQGISIQSASGSLSITGGSQIQSILSGANANQLPAQGNAGPIEIKLGGDITLGGLNNMAPSIISTEAQSGTVGNAGKITIRANSLEISGQGNSQIFDGTISTTLDGAGTAGDIDVELDDAFSVSGFGSGVRSGVDVNGEGNSGGIKIIADSISLANLSVIEATHVGIGVGVSGDIDIRAQDQITLKNSSVQTILGPNVQGQSGDIDISAVSVLVENNPGIDAITTEAINGNSGSIAISADEVLLRQNSDITTTTFSGASDAGSITFSGGFVFAFDDSDISTIAFDAENNEFGGRGGDINFDQTIAFFGENPLFNGSVLTIDGNERVDINALGGIQPGVISVPDISFIEDNLNELSSEFVDTAALTAGSCITRANEDNTGSFVVTGGEGLQQQPGTAPLAVYPTDSIQSPAETTVASDIQEAHGVYQLADGRLVLSHECG